MCLNLGWNCLGLEFLPLGLKGKSFGLIKLHNELVGIIGFVCQRMCKLSKVCKRGLGSFLGGFVFFVVGRYGFD